MSLPILRLFSFMTRSKGCRMMIITLPLSYKYKKVDAMVQVRQQHRLVSCRVCTRTFTRKQYRSVCQVLNAFNKYKICVEAKSQRSQLEHWAYRCYHKYFSSIFYDSYMYLFTHQTGGLNRSVCFHRLRVK